MKISFLYFDCFSRTGNNKRVKSSKIICINLLLWDYLLWAPCSWSCLNSVSIRIMPVVSDKPVINTWPVPFPAWFPHTVCLNFFSQSRWYHPVDRETCWLDQTSIQRDADKFRTTEISLVVHWLRLCLLMQGVQVRFLVEQLRSHMPWYQKRPKHKMTEAIL